MGRAAFYAPMKAPHSPVPSGDREMARNLMQVLDRAGYAPVLASDLRIYDKLGDPDHQHALIAQAEQEVLRLGQTLPGDISVWVTYHNYYKAPDLLGPRVCQARGIPYVQIESTRASSRLGGRWDMFARHAHAACDAAQVVFYQTANDLITLERDRPDAQQLIHLPPFLPDVFLPAQPASGVGLLSVGMMREGDKLASYRIIAETLALLNRDWSLEIAGDGPARAEVEAMMAPFGARVTFLGQLGPEAMRQAYARAGLFFWPGVNEAYGMAYLEAQAAGLPVIAQDRPGVRDVLAKRRYPAPHEGASALAKDIEELLAAPARRKELAGQARSMIAQKHLISAATDIVKRGLDALTMR